VSSVRTVGGFETVSLHAFCTWSAEIEWPPSPVKHSDVSMRSGGTPTAFAMEERINARSEDGDAIIAYEVDEDNRWSRSEEILSAGLGPCS
jgi:hypothetical protein